jgi:hypothetical protein
MLINPYHNKKGDAYDKYVHLWLFGYRSGGFDVWDPANTSEAKVGGESYK